MELSASSDENTDAAGPGWNALWVTSLFQVHSSYVWCILVKMGGASTGNLACTSWLANFELEQLVQIIQRLKQVGADGEAIYLTLKVA